ERFRPRDVALALEAVEVDLEVVRDPVAQGAPVLNALLERRSRQAHQGQAHPHSSPTIITKSIQAGCFTNPSRSLIDSMCRLIVAFHVRTTACPRSRAYATARSFSA